MAEERFGSIFIFKLKSPSNQHAAAPFHPEFLSHICHSLMEMLQRHSPFRCVSSFPHNQTESRCLCQLQSVTWIQEIRGKTTFKNKREEREVGAGFVLADTVQSENSISLPRCSSVTTMVVWTKATFSAMPHEMVIGHISTRIIERMIAKEQECDCGRR